MPSPRDDEFLRHLSHELRNPLSPLRHGLQLLQRFRSGDHSMAAVLDIMERQMTKLSQLVDELDAHRLGRTAPAFDSALSPAVPAPVAPVAPAATTAATAAATAATAGTASTASARIATIEDTGPQPPRQVPWERVMVVDDDVDAAQGLAALLRSMGPTVEIAADGHQALQLADRFRPQLVFMDIVMPQLDGLQTARALRTEPWAADLIICALTGSGDPHDQAGSSLAGIDYHLVKPVDPRALVAIMSD